MPDLKLIALDAEDLSVLSANLQDAVVRVADMAFLKAEKRFAAVLNRFDWEHAIKDAKGRKTYERRRAGLRFERVLAASVSGVDLKDPRLVLSLLTIGFEPTDAPAGHVTLHFSGGSRIRLLVECVEAELKDLGAAWATRKKPGHEDNDPKESAS